jgi:putative DNA primase/helicase
MGVALDHLDEAARRQIAEGLFATKKEYDGKGELTGLCPVHEDKNASFSYNYKKDVFNCSSCHATGDLVDLWSRVKGYGPEDGFKAFCREYGIKRAGGNKDGPPGTTPSPRPAPRKEKHKDGGPPPLDDVFEMLGPLPPDWIAWLKTHRGWSEEVIKRRNLKLQTHYQAKKTGEIKKLRKPERVAIPIPDDDGHIRNIRLYKPGKLREKESKIISWGADYGAARLFPPSPDPDKSPVVLCEGEPDMLCAESQGLNAITQTSKPKQWTRDHARKFENRDVVIAYDADQAGQHYANDYAAPHLAKVVRSLRGIDWPEFMGKGVDGLWPEDHGQDLTDFFVKHRKTLDDMWPLIDEAVPIDVLPHITSQAREFFSENFNGRLTFRARLVAEKIMEKHRVLSDPGSGMIYRWNGRYWQEFHEDHVKALAIKLLGCEAQKSRIEDAVYQVKNLSTLPDGRSINDYKHLVCLKNGMLDLETWKLYPHKEDYFATFELGVTFDPDSTRVCDRWLSFLRQGIQTPEVIQQVQEFFGYCLTKDVIHAKSLFLVGPGSDGKSVMLKVLRELVGKDNTSSVSFNELENQFLRASLYQKAVNFSTETSSTALESEYFKKIAAGDPINAAFKHKDSFEFSPFCKLVFSANRLPRVLDNSDGFYRRVLPIQFKRQFKEDDPDTDPWLFEKLKAELSEIFAWSLVGLHRLWKEGRFTDCQETQEALLFYKRLNNPVLCFVDDRCLMGDEYTTDKTDLFKEYQKYCGTNGYKAFSRENFFRELYAAKDNLQLIRPRVEGKRIQKIQGIAINDFLPE